MDNEITKYLINSNNLYYIERTFISDIILRKFKYYIYNNKQQYNFVFNTCKENYTLVIICNYIRAFLVILLYIHILFILQATLSRLLY